MRLICPNCDAQYEVDERAVPDAGRDVQCSNCGHAWFQNPEGYEGDGEIPAGQMDQPDDNAEPNMEPEDASGDDAQTTQAAIGALIHGISAKGQEFEEVPEPDALETTEMVSETAPETPALVSEEPQRRGLNDGVRDVLRAEASRETRARHGDPESIETQEELGLEETPAARNQRGVAAQERMARLRGLDVDEGSRPESGKARRDLLPDIEEINSSLAPIGNNERVDDFAEPAPRKSGFGRGFILMLALAAAISLIYVYAPLIGEKFPALIPYLESFVSLIDKARDWLDQMVTLALAKVSDTA